MNELSELSNSVVWGSRDECVYDCAESWRLMDFSTWQFIAKVHHAKLLYGDDVLVSIAEERHGSVKTLRNMSSLWNNPARDIAMELELTPGHVNVIAGLASDNIEQAEDYLRTAAERSLSVGDLRWHIKNTGSTFFPDVRTQHYNPEPSNILYSEVHRGEIVLHWDMAPSSIVAELLKLDKKLLHEIVNSLKLVLDSDDET